MRTKFCVFRGTYDHQRTLVIRIVAITLASESAMTLARFRPSKLFTVCFDCLALIVQLSFAWLVLLVC